MIQINLTYKFFLDNVVLFDWNSFSLERVLLIFPSPHQSEDENKIRETTFSLSFPVPSPALWDARPLMSRESPEDDPHVLHALLRATIWHLPFGPFPPSSPQPALLCETQGFLLRVRQLVSTWRWLRLMCTLREGCQIEGGLPLSAFPASCWILIYQFF